MRKTGRYYLNMGVLFLLITIFMVACSSKEDFAKKDKPMIDDQHKEEEKKDSKGYKEEKENNEEKEVNEDNENKEDKDKVDGDKVSIDNNGGLYVSYNDSVYYRQYTKDNFATVGLFGSYEIIPSSVKNMIALKDGVKEVAFTDTGEGPIYIYKDRMYLQGYDEDWIPSLYSVDLAGEKEQIIGYGWIEDLDMETGIFVCTLADKNNIYQLFQLDGTTGALSKYELENPCGEVLALEDGVIYYQGLVDTDDSILGAVKLCRVNVDGSNEMILAETKEVLYEYGDRETIIPTIQFLDDFIYFSYGAYGGTGHFYQGGNIARVGKDGSNLQVLVGKVDLRPVANDEFYVAKDKDRHVLYYAELSENLDYFALDISSGNTEKTDFIPHEANKPFEYNDGVWIYSDGNPNMTEWIPHVDYSALGVDGDYYAIDDVQLCDNWVYYKIQVSEEEPEASIGWREGYRRLKTQVIREEMKGDKKEVLFEY